MSDKIKSLIDSLDNEDLVKFTTEKLNGTFYFIIVLRVIVNELYDMKKTKLEIFNLVKYWYEKHNLPLRSIEKQINNCLTFRKKCLNKKEYVSLPTFIHLIDLIKKPHICLINDVDDFS